MLRLAFLSTAEAVVGVSTSVCTCGILTGVGMPPPDSAGTGRPKKIFGVVASGVDVSAAICTVGVGAKPGDRSDSEADILQFPKPRTSLDDSTPDSAVSFHPSMGLYLSAAPGNTVETWLGVRWKAAKDWGNRPGTLVYRVMVHKSVGEHTVAYVRHCATAFTTPQYLRGAHRIQISISTRRSGPAVYAGRVRIRPPVSHPPGCGGGALRGGGR